MAQIVLNVGEVLSCTAILIHPAICSTCALQNLLVFIPAADIKRLEQPRCPRKHERIQQHFI